MTYSKLFIILTLLSSCSPMVSHKQKGISTFNSYQPNDEMTEDLQTDLKQCRNYAEKMRIKSGIRYYRNTNRVIRDCLKNKGWEFSLFN